ncbi:MAG: hypothetical protein E6Q89_02910 [Bacteroidia bacterium]|nr:MAG: hypothetical protein E6Q89_02910 [Bacteroidia bacterium]
MKKIILIALCLMSINVYSQEANGIGFLGNAFLSPSKTGKMYYGVIGSIYTRIPTKNNPDFAVVKLNVGKQFHELVDITDFGATLRISPIKYSYIGVSPYTYRSLIVKETDDGTGDVVFTEKNYGSAHLGFSIPITEDFKFEGEVNYNYFYKSRAAGYGFSAGLVLYCF